MRGNIYRARARLLAEPPSAVLSGSDTVIAPDKLDQIGHDFGEEYDAPVLDWQLIGELFASGAARGHANNQSDNYALDRWLAPRLHASVRLSRRIVSDRAFWAWFAMALAPRYVFERWGDGSTVNAWRFTGDLLRNGVSRLWWAAELLRNGPDYAAVDKGLRRVRVAQFALELKYSWYRPAAIAFASVASDPSSPLTDEQLQALSKRANAYLPLAPLEAIGPDLSDHEPDDAWWNGACTLRDLLEPEPPPGPEDGYADKTAIEALERWFREVLAELPVSGSAT